MLRVSDCVADRVRLAVPQATKRQHIGNQINAALVFARMDFVNVLLSNHRAGWLSVVAD